MFIDQEKAMTALEEGFSDRPILVVGDLMLDRYLWGKVDRISPEAPVPVVHVERETESGGAACNVVLNLAGLGAAPLICGLIGSREVGKRLMALLESAGVETDYLTPLEGWTTITKTRVIGGHQQMLRLDRETPAPDPEAAAKKLIASIRAAMERKPAAVILSDYAKGTLSEPVCRAAIAAAKEAGVPVLVDPKGMDYSKYAGATLLSPNRKELGAAVRMSLDDLDPLLEAGAALRKTLNLDYLAVTLSEQGIALMGDGETRHIPAMAQEVFDVSGAGDTVIATMAAGLAAGLTPPDAMHLANLAAGVVVGKVGTTPVRREEILAALTKENAQEQSNKILSLADARNRVEAWRKKGERIVFTNGCFDLLHAGHVSYMEKARNQGNRLVVGLNSDDSVRRLKGPTRPITHQEDRARVLAALAAVDMVVIFGEDTPMNLIDALRPEILAKGADYTEATVVGAKEVKSWGGRVALIPLEEGRSTTNIINAAAQPGSNG